MSNKNLTDVCCEIANKWKRKWGEDLFNSTFTILIEGPNPQNVKDPENELNFKRLFKVSRFNGFYVFNIYPTNLYIIMIGKSHKGYENN